MTPAEILKAARAKIEKPENWCQGHYAENAEGETVSYLSDSACRLCASGACAIFSGSIGASGEVVRLLRVSALEILGATHAPEHKYPPVYINDNTDHPTVMAMFSGAIALAEQEER
jgi:hypothetical protein